jgi:acyl-CoA reductase-like NAD-dependent aldehyde dehydrogenase
VDSIIPPLLKKGDYIYGTFVKSSQSSGFINDSNPGDRSDQIGRFPFSLQNTKEAIKYASKAQDYWRISSLQERLLAVNNFHKELGERSHYLTDVLVREIGIPMWEARQEINDTKQVIEELIPTISHIFSQKPIQKDLSIKYYPIGTIAILTPFSQPLLLPSLFSCASILTGNSIIHKPSKYTPGVGQAIAELWDRCKLPRGLYNMVQGPGSHIGQYILSHPKINGTLFAGNYSTVEEIQKKNNPPPHHPFIAFLGGKSSAIVMEDCNIDNTVREILAGAFRYTGQRPTSIARVFVSRAISARLLDTLAKSLDQIPIGYGKEQSTYLGPMVSEHWRTRYHRYGHNLYSNGHVPIRQTENLENNRRGYYVKPALYKVNWTNGSPMLNDEPPGPILLVYEVNDIEEAVGLHNQTQFRRMTSIFTNKNRTDLPSIFKNIHTGALFLNQAPKETASPIGAQGFSSNMNASGTDLLNQLLRKQVQFTTSTEEY